MNRRPGPEQAQLEPVSYTHLDVYKRQQLGCAFDEGPLGPYLRVDDFKQTTVPGVYAAGDASTAMGNATLASAAGVMAGVGVHQSLVQDDPAKCRRAQNGRPV